MATLSLTKTYVNLVSTGAAVSGQSGRGRGEEYAADGEVTTFAGGRRRSITAVGVATKYTFRLLFLPRASVDLLQAWQGQLVQVRDHKGRRFFGVYHQVAVDEIVSRSTWHVAIGLIAVTSDEGV